MKFFYYKLYVLTNKKKSLYFKGVEAHFCINNFEKLRYIENVFEKSDNDESHILASILQILQPGDVAYDIGANIGLHSIFMAKKVGEKGKVIAFEPESRNYEALKRNLELNNLDNITTIQVALGNEFNDGNLFVKKKIGYGTVSLIKSEDSSFCQEIEIVPGDFLIQNRNLPIPKVVKIDVEGYEYSVITGLRKTLLHRTCQLVCCEIHSDLFPLGTRPQMVLDLLKSIGFTRVETCNRGTEIHAICYKE